MTKFPRVVSSDLAASWWLFALRGVAAIAFGVAVFLGPATSLLALVTLWAAYALTEGVLTMLSASMVRSRWLTFEGVVGAGVGLFALAAPRLTSSLVLMLMCGWAMATGIAATIASVRMRRQLGGEWMLTATGVLAIAFGALVVLLPDSAALAPVWSVAAYGVVFGLFLIGFAFGLRRPSTLRSEQSMTVGTDPITA